MTICFSEGYIYVYKDVISIYLFRYIYTKNIHVWCIIYVYIHIIVINNNVDIDIYLHVRNCRNLLNWSPRPYSFREKPAYQASFGFGHALGAHPDNSKQGGAHAFVFPSGCWIYYCELMLIQFKNKERHGDMANYCSNFFWGCDYKSNQLQLSFSYWFVEFIEGKAGISTHLTINVFVYRNECAKWFLFGKRSRCNHYGEFPSEWGSQDNGESQHIHG